MNINPTTNANEKPDFRDRLKFYADTPKKKNEYFCFELSSILTLKEALWRFFDKGWNIRSAWYEKVEIGVDLETGEIIKTVLENTRLDLNAQMEEYLKEKLYAKKKKVWINGRSNGQIKSKFCINTIFFY